MSLDQVWALSYNSKTIDILRNSKYAIPLIQSVHLLGITMLLGSLVILSLRLLGLGLKEFSMRTLVAQVWRWGLWGLGITVGSGLLVFIPDPSRYAANTAFRLKMVLLVGAVLYQFVLFRKAVRSETAERPSRRNAIIAGLALTLWFMVGWAGRAIGFLG